MKGTIEKKEEIMKRNPKIVVVVLGLLGWLPTGAIGFGADPFGAIMELVGSMFGAWIAVSCVVKVSTWLKARRRDPTIEAKHKEEES